MRLFGQSTRLLVPALRCGLLVLAAGLTAPAFSQTAPQVIPFTITTYAGPNPVYSDGAACGSFISFDPQGDGCLALAASVGIDAHDLRVDSKGNVYWIDNDSGSNTLVHKINPVTHRVTVYLGSTIVTKGCNNSSTNYNANCINSDGAANNTTGYTYLSKNARGMAIAPNGDLFLADYNSDYILKIAASTGLFTTVAGNGAAVSGSSYSGPASTTGIGSSRGVGVDASGNIYIAETAQNIVVEVTAVPTTINGTLYPAGQIVALTGPNSGGTKTVANGVVATSAIVDAPEDVKIDSYGNVIIADTGNTVIRAIYRAGTLPGVVGPVVGNIYTIAGTGTAPSTVAGTPSTTYPNSPYPNGTIAPPVLATSVQLEARKLSIDAHNNIYLADSNENVVWFIDAATGYIRVIAGALGTTTIPSCTGGAANGDGCPATLAGFNFNYGGTNTNGAVDADNQGNLYLNDAQGGIAASSRIRKVLSGLNFATPITAGSSSTQTVFIHFGVNDSQGTFVSNNPDFAVGTPNCFSNSASDKTTDCLLPITFTPSHPGPETSTLTVTSSAGLKSSFLVTGTGTAPLFATDPGNIAVLNTAAPTAFVSSINLTNAGLGYTSAPTVTFSAPTGPGGVTATGTATIANTQVVSATITNPGSGYTSAPTVTFSAPPAPGYAATATAIIGNSGQAIALDGAGNAYIADTLNNRVLLYSATTQTTTLFAGTGSAGYTGDGSAATSATLTSPKAVTLDTDGNVYIADTGNNVIRKVNASGIISTVAGGGTACANKFDALGDGCPATSATLSAPAGIAMDAQGQLYIADSGNNLIRQVSVLGTIFTIAGGGSGCPTQTDTPAYDGCSALAAAFANPTGLAFDPTGGFLFIADTGHNIVRKMYLGTTITPSGTTYVPSGVFVNPMTLVAGTGAAGSAPNTLATLSQLNAPTGVAIDAAENVYIADTQNSAVRLVDSATGDIATIFGIVGSTGVDPVLPGSATDAQLALPSSVAVLPSGTLYVADAGNNRVLSDTRASTTYNFGRVNLGTSSNSETFAQSSIGNSSAALSNPAYVASGNTSQFNFAPAGSSLGCIASTSYAPGTFCQYAGSFSPTVTGTPSATYTETGATSLGTAPNITLTGTGAQLTPTTPAVSQLSPTGSPQYGASVTFSVTVGAACNAAAPSCFPSGTVRFIVNNVAGGNIQLPTGSATVTQVVTSLQLGNNTISCSYSGDFYYAAGSCPTINITVTQAGTMSVLAIVGNNQTQYPTNNCSVITSGIYKNDTQCVSATFNATVTSSTIGIPSGTVTFFANGTTNLGTATLNNSTGVASLPLTEILTPGDIEVASTTLPPGTYTVTCTYNGATDYATSSCPGMTYTVVADPATITNITPLGCSITILSVQGTTTPLENDVCPSSQSMNGFPEVSTADGASTDASIFVTPSNTLSGTLTFSCSGLPQYVACTFSPTSILLTPGTGHVIPVYTDVTFFTDVPAGNVSSVAQPGFAAPSGVTLASVIGWPIAAFGLIGFLGLRRRKHSMGALTLLALVLMLTGGALTLNGCAGPGAYKPALTPAGVYPITISVTNGTVTGTTTVYLNVTAPGIPGQQ